MPSSALSRRGAVAHVAADDLGAGGQIGARGVAHEAADVVAVAQQHGQELAADVAGGAGQEDPLRGGHRPDAYAPSHPQR